MPLIPAGFPPYEYRPYPKFLTLADGSNVIADHAQHEAEIMASQAKAPEPELTDEEREAAEAERESLLAQCKARGIKVHPRSGIDKIKGALA